MTAAKPQSKAEQINDKIALIMAAGGAYRSADEFEIRLLFKEANDVAKHHAGEASCIKADIHCLLGDWQEVLRWCANARANRHAQRADLTEMVCSAALGYFSHCAALYRQIVNVDSNFLSQQLTSGLICGTFTALIEKSEIAERAKLELSQHTKDEIVIARDAKGVLDRLGLPEVALTAMLDVAGEVMREHRVIWSNTRPKLLIVNDDDDLGMTYQLAVPVSPELASTMSDEVIERIVMRDLDKPGISFVFVADEVH